MTATTFAPVTTAPALAGGAVITDAKPMPAEQVEAHVGRIQVLIDDLESHVLELRAASWGNSDNASLFPYEASRWLPNGTRSDLTKLLQAVIATLEDVVEEADAAG